MSFTTDEQRIHDSNPRELFEFVMSGGDVAAYYYTSHDEDLSVLGNTYVAVEIRRRPFATSDVETVQELLVEMAYDLAIVDEVAYRLPPRETILTVRRYHTNIANVSQIWKGHVAGTIVRGRLATMRIPSLLGQALETQIPSIIVQSLCNHVLYGVDCFADRASKTTSTTIATIDATNPRSITTADSMGVSSQKLGGEIKRLSDGERRFVVAHTGAFGLTLDRAFRNLAVSDAVEVYHGCDHAAATCRGKFNNLPRFGGFPGLPSTALFRYGITGSGR